jgi:hypothetical protein
VTRWVTRIVLELRGCDLGGRRGYVFANSRDRGAYSGIVFVIGFDAQFTRSYSLTTALAPFTLRVWLTICLWAALFV